MDRNHDFSSFIPLTQIPAETEVFRNALWLRCAGRTRQATINSRVCAEIIVFRCNGPRGHNEIDENPARWGDDCRDIDRGKLCASLTRALEPRGSDSVRGDHTSRILRTAYPDTKTPCDEVRTLHRRRGAMHSHLATPTPDLVKKQVRQ